MGKKNKKIMWLSKEGNINYARHSVKINVLYI